LSAANSGNIKYDEVVTDACGILGLVRFRKGYYLIMITQK